MSSKNKKEINNNPETIKNDLVKINNTKNVDEVINYFNKNRNEIVNLFTNNYKIGLDKLIEKNYYIMVDKKCLCNMGKYDMLRDDDDEGICCPLIGKQNICINCLLLSRIIELRSDATDKIVTIEYGSYKDRKIIVRKELGNNFNINIRYDISEYINKKNKTKIDIIELDKISNYVFNTWILNIYLESKGSTNVPKLFTSFLCRNNYFIIEDSVTSNLVDIFTDEELKGKSDDDKIKYIKIFLISTISQIINFTEMAKDLDFLHGCPILKNLAYNKLNRKYTIKIGKQNLSTDIVLKVLNSIYSSIKVNSVKLLNSPFKTVNLSQLNKRIIQTDEYYVLDYTMIHLIKYSLDISLYTFQDSYNFYFFFTSILMNEDFYPLIRDTEILDKIFNEMWKLEDIKNIEEDLDKIRKIKQDIDYNIIFEFLAGKKLIKNIIAICIKLYK